MADSKYEGIQIQNSIGAGPKETFKIRETYDEVFPDIVSSYDFNSEQNLFYGRIDYDQDIVHANEFYLTQIKSTKSEEVFCLNFVSDAFEDFKNSIKIQYTNRLKPDEFFTTDWDAEKGWETPHGFYDNRMSDVNQVFVKGNLFLKNNKDLIRNIDDFFRVFFNDFYFSMHNSMPLTKSGIIASKYYNPSSTGMCIEISNDSTGLDSVKFEKFIKSPNFEFYLLTAADHGFVVDRNVPWRLIANLNSPKMQQYMALHNLNQSNIFSTCFVKTHKYDIQNLKVYMKQMYNYFLSISPIYTVMSPSFDKCTPYDALEKTEIQREKISEEAYSEAYPDIFWLKLYYRLKLNEKKIKIANVILMKEVEKIEQTYNSLDFDQTLDYINGRIKSQTS